MFFGYSAKIPASKCWLLNLGMLVRKMRASTAVRMAPVRPGMVRNKASVKFFGLSYHRTGRFYSREAPLKGSAANARC